MAGRPAFPPSVVVAVKALACELPGRCGVPLARWSRTELQRAVLAQGLVAAISGTTIWRWLAADAIQPWRVRSWLFPRDPAFAAKAGRVLDLYERRWDGVPLGPTEYVLSAAKARCRGFLLRGEPECGVRVTGLLGTFAQLAVRGSESMTTQGGRLESSPQRRAESPTGFDAL